MNLALFLFFVCNTNQYKKVIYSELFFAN